ncbi:MAG: hypothetical protein AAF409_03000 [Pseudomonadota bacterium]
MNCFSVILGALVGVMLCAPAGADPSGPDTSTRAAYTKACSHYVNRARFKDRSGEPEFVVILADSCLAALNSLGSARVTEQAAAADFLERLLELRDTVIAMNMERLFGKSYDRSTRLQSPKYQQSEAIAHVSATGEYLIAYRMGLIAARKAWLDTEPDFALAPTPKR